ncbi:hypothetical protein [Caulobacter sp.]|uniref:hypothetical protein n=1 Tax=Caulobacter sp. TaxID=78 RepID=UPI0031D9F2DE
MFEFTKTTFDHIDDDLIAQHLASGMPRYSNTLHLSGGGFIRRWTDDEAEARTQLQADRADPKLSWAIAFDHMTVWALDVAFPANSKSAEQLQAECDEALDAMFERWANAEEGAR